MPRRRTKRLQIVAHRTFTRASVVLDGYRFEQCHFRECVMHYAGAPADIFECTFAPNTRWAFSSDAANTIVLLEKLGFRIEAPPRHSIAGTGLGSAAAFPAALASD